MLDMIKPTTPGCITLADLKRCKMTPIFFDTFFNLEKYMEHEQRDPFAQRDNDDVGIQSAGTLTIPIAIAILIFVSNFSSPTGIGTQPRSTSCWWPKREVIRKGKSALFIIFVLFIFSTKAIEIPLTFMTMKQCTHLLSPLQKGYF